MTPVGISGAWLRRARVFSDTRGSFHEWFQGAEIRAVAGHDFGLRQANCVVSRRGALRGVHYTATPPGQAKYFTCLSGAMLAAVVDIRVGSPTFGQSRTVELDAGQHTGLYVSEGLGQAFLALTDDTVLIYLCSRQFDPGVEHAINPLDPQLGIAWPGDVVPDLSEKDSAAPTLAEAQRLGLLPTYTEPTT
ncbi:dTDP-4-dehydrorhamnose 3,5-epimerase family protein [Rhizomonospora bruguierae]|uniref:dTDP-4-dehydrorhamnose 3,5-epimerase family protein n=1 Tax=Rhizomonospora bruguierae TaxID=1581705 RepID=UPI001BD13E28|nr:dTDP-4-dehydrorhamnose 3,5-epimerase [Micromonospora sp. NBRC 107566]